MRLFVGVGLDREVREALAASAREAEKLFPGRYCAADNYHVTLAFIGEAARIPAIRAAMARAAAGTEPFSIALCRLGYFRQPREAVLFCGLMDSLPMERLAIDVHRALAKAGFLLEGGDFHPHITLARQARIDPKGLAQVPVDALTQQVKEIVLFESRREQDRLRYAPLFACRLGKSGT